uniref:Uncharacterized protein n=1 Tax=Nelumbo nucifera TaxID=4432 RepID=A0A822YF25_NELNU|nr:TPA_asm: hypothetical protein HUJ06_009981 [Nelumbo nucifera]
MLQYCWADWRVLVPAFPLRTKVLTCHNLQLAYTEE